MIDRQKLETILTRRFASAGRDQIAAAANAIMGLGDEWEEVGEETVFGYRFYPGCASFCGLARDIQDGVEFRVLRRRIVSDLTGRNGVSLESESAARRA